MCGTRSAPVNGGSRDCRNRQQHLVSTTINDAFGVDIPWWIFALATFAIVWVLTHFGIKLSMRTTVICGAIEMAIMLALAITFLAGYLPPYWPAPGLAMRKK